MRKTPLGAVLLIMFGFACGIMHDVASYRRVHLLKIPLVILSMFSYIIGGWMLVEKSPRVALPSSVRCTAAFVSGAAFLGMVYSIAIEIPFRKAWIERGHTSQLVSSGTYSVSRHPGVLWASVWVPGVAMASGSKDLLVWWPMIIAGDVVYVWIEDRFILPRVFGQEYREYQGRVPFILPLMRLPFHPPGAP
jgi:protein-S-isoprenylcysteine O-methyltransferase Ste14